MLLLWLPAYARGTSHQICRDEACIVHACRAAASTENPPSPVGEGTGGEVKEALERARRFKGKKNSDWQPFIHPFDSVEMCLVPCGRFRMGNDKEAYFWDDNKSEWVQGVPDGDVQTFAQPFWIDRYPVTNAEYKREVTESNGKVREPLDTDWYNNPLRANHPPVRCISAGMCGSGAAAAINPILIAAMIGGRI